MGPVIAIAAIMAVVGGGAGAYAYYQKNVSGSGPGGSHKTCAGDPAFNNVVSAVTGCTVDTSSAGPFVASVTNTILTPSTGGAGSNKGGISGAVSSAFVPSSGKGAVNTDTTAPVPVPDRSYTGGPINPSTQKIVPAPGAPVGAPIAIGTPGGTVPTNYGVVVKK